MNLAGPDARAAKVLNLLRAVAVARLDRAAMTLQQHIAPVRQPDLEDIPQSHFIPSHAFAQSFSGFNPRQAASPRRSHSARRASPSRKANGIWSSLDRLQRPSPILPLLRRATEISALFLTTALDQRRLDQLTVAPDAAGSPARDCESSGNTRSAERSPPMIMIACAAGSSSVFSKRILRQWRDQVKVFKNRDTIARRVGLQRQQARHFANRVNLQQARHRHPCAIIEVRIIPAADCAAGSAGLPQSRPAMSSSSQLSAWAKAKRQARACQAKAPP